MDVGREIISSLLVSGDFNTLTEAGLSRSWLEGNNTGSSVIFSGTDKQAYLWLLDYYRRYRKTPQLEIFRQHFPEESFRLVKNVIPLAELAELASDKINSFLIADLVGRVIDLHDKDKIDDAVKLLQLESKRLSSGIKSRKPKADSLSDYDLEHLLNSKMEMGVPFGIEKIDDAFFGFQPGQLISLMGRQKAGKAVSVDTLLPTPHGWKTMKEVSVGEEVFGSDGKPCKIISVSDIMTDHDCYEVSFSDGETVIADGDHLWETIRRVKKRSACYETAVSTTTEIMRTLKCDGGKVNRHKVRVAEPLVFPEADLPLDPYLLGYWLGDGTSSAPEITCHEDDIDFLLWKIDLAGYMISSDNIRKGTRTHKVYLSDGNGGKFIHKLRSLDVLNNKHIPDIYLQSSIYQRTKLLQGIMDSDGHASNKGFEISQKNRRLLTDIRELMNSLGIQTREESRIARINGKEFPHGRLQFYGSTDIEIFSLPRKSSVSPKWSGNRSKYRHIVSVTPVASVPVRCIMVDSKDHTYLCGKGMIPTHNSWLTLLSALEAWKAGYTVLFFSVEMDTSILRQRLMCLGAHVSPSRMRRGTLSTSDKDKVRQFDKLLAESENGEEPRFFISQKKSLITLDDVEEEINQYNPNVVYIDGFSFMVDRRTGRMTDDWQANENVAAELKALTMEEEITIFVNTQVQEKQHHSRFGIEARTIAGGTGLLKASDLIIGLDKDTDTRELTVNCVRSRFEDFDSVVMEIDWDTMEFIVIEPGEKVREMGV